MLTFFKIVLILIDVIAALLLIGIILIQKSKSEGLGGLSFGAGMGEALFGSRTGNVLTRGTITLAIVFLVTTTLLGVITPKSTQTRSIIDENVPDIPVAPVAPIAPPPVAPISPAAPAPAAGPITLPAPAALPSPAAAPAPAAAAVPETPSAPAVPATP